MKKITCAAFFIILFFTLFSCDNSDMGTPPELVLGFSIDVLTTDDPVNIDYTLTNDGEADLENCKIQIGIDTTGNEAANYTYWTEGIDLNEGKTYTGSVSINIIGTAQNVMVLAAGFDNPDRSKMSSERIIIYYNTP